MHELTDVTRKWLPCVNPDLSDHVCGLHEHLTCHSWFQVQGAMFLKDYKILVSIRPMWKADRIWEFKIELIKEMFGEH